MSVAEGLLLVTDYGSDFISVVWGTRSVADVVLYRVEAATQVDNNGRVARQATQEVSSYSASPGAPPRYTFTNLRPGQRYVLSLDIVRDFNDPISTTIVQYTSKCLLDVYKI